jgi:hypothetical protein
MEVTGESIRYDGPNETNSRGSRWPVISRTNNASSRLTLADEKARRSQVFIIIKKFWRCVFHFDL